MKYTNSAQWAVFIKSSLLLLKIKAFPSSYMHKKSEEKNFASRGLL